MVPEPKGEAKARHGGAQEGRREREAADGAQELPRERQRHEHSEEEDRPRASRAQLMSGRRFLPLLQQMYCKIGSIVRERSFFRCCCKFCRLSV